MADDESAVQRYSTSRTLTLRLHQNYAARETVDLTLAPLDDLGLIQPWMERYHGRDYASFNDVGLPGFGLIGNQTDQMTPPGGRVDVTGHAADTVSYFAGKHRFRFGGEIRKSQVNAFYHRRSRGVFFFDGTGGPWFPDFQNGTGFFQGIDIPNYDFNVLTLADFMAGNVSHSSMLIGHTERLVHVNTFDFFFQDAWQLTPKLNLNYGIRYDCFGPLHDSGKDLSIFLPARGGLVLAGTDIPSGQGRIGPRGNRHSFHIPVRLEKLLTTRGICLSSKGRRQPCRARGDITPTALPKAESWFAKLFNGDQPKKLHP